MKSGFITLQILIVFALWAPNDHIFAQNFTYDQNGRLTSDPANSISLIEWNIFEKVSRVVSKDAEVEFFYDTRGNRIKKVVKPKSANGLMPPSAWKYIYYQYDAEGKEVCQYSRSFNNQGASRFTDEFAKSEQAMHSGRQYFDEAETEIKADFVATEANEFEDIVYRGIINPSNAGNGHMSRRGKKRYEITNHGSHVMAVVTDRKQQASTELAFAQDYYPYGMVQPARTTGPDLYAYGFGGKNTDGELSGPHNNYNFGARLFDPRLGRWWSVDKLTTKTPSQSPYHYAGNSPISMGDPDGNETVYEVIYNKDKKGGRMIVHTDIVVTNSSVTFIENYKKILQHYYTPKEWRDFRTGYLWTVSFDFDVLKTFEAFKKAQAEGLLLQPDGSVNGFLYSNTPITFGNNDRSNTENFYIADDGIGRDPDYNDLQSHNSHVLIHETGHYMGLSDRYVEMDPELMENNNKHTDLSRSEYESGLLRNDVMSSGLTISATHIENMLMYGIDNSDPNASRSFVMFESPVYVDQKNGKLVGPFLTVPYMRNRAAYHSIKRGEELRRKREEEKLHYSERGKALNK